MIKELLDINKEFSEIQINDEVAEILKQFNELSDMIIEDIAQDKVQVQDIPSLKKRIKYCKNPMEKKKLQQELNVLYKEQKRRR